MKAIFSLFVAALCFMTASASAQSWTADNGNGSYTNPLFYEEFSDPDVIRVGDTYYLAGTTMHAMPGLTVLQSKDLVNWEFASYCFDRLDLGPEFRLAQGKELYGQGIWAPAIRHHNGMFYIFSNINGHGTQVFRSRSAKGPWQHTRLKTTLYDLSVLFDGGKIYAVCGVDEISLVELNSDVTDVVPNTRRVIIKRGSGMGEGLHLYKVNGKYFIVSALPGGHTPMVCARAETLDGPWEIETLVRDESLGVATGNTLFGQGGTPQSPTFDIRVPNDGAAAIGLTIHQGGLVDTPSGQWWSVIMQDHRSVGRVSCLVPVTWQNGWPMIGLPGNVRRAPKTWIKPETGHKQAPRAPFVRSDNFSQNKLQPVWQWNHLPDDQKWSLSEKRGALRLHSLPAKNFWWARNTLTQRAIGPASTVTVQLGTAGMKANDVAGLALLNLPYAWLGVVRSADGTLVVRQFDQNGGQTTDLSLSSDRFWLRAECDFDSEQAIFSYSIDGQKFTPIGQPMKMVFQLKTFQGIRYSLFHFNSGGAAGGYADFDNFSVSEPRAKEGRGVPVGKTIRFTNVADASVLIVRDGKLCSVRADDPAVSTGASLFRVVDLGRGQVALKSVQENRFLSVNRGDRAAVVVAGTDTEANGSFQWIDLERGQIMLMALATNRYVTTNTTTTASGAALLADSPGPRPDRKDGSWLTWQVAK